MLPWPQWGRLRWSNPCSQRDVRHYALSRFAMLAFYQSQGVGPGESVLVPAYHCQSMIDPVRRLGAQPLLYRINADLGTDMEALAALHAKAAKKGRLRFLLAGHFFAHTQDLSSLRAFCDAAGLVLLEDCAHLPLRGQEDASVIGAGHWGDYVFSSPAKLFACGEGGLLWSPSGKKLPPAPAARGLTAQISGGLRLARSLGQGSSINSGLTFAQGHELGVDIRIDNVALFSACHPATLEDRSGLAAAAQLMRHVDIGPLVAVRRKRYAHWLDVLQGLAGVKPLYAQLGAHDVPYVVPVVVDRPEPLYAALKWQGFPVGRWDCLAQSDCAVAKAYRLGLFHLPCHQALTDVHLQVLMDCFTTTLAATSGVS